MHPRRKSSLGRSSHRSSFPFESIVGVSPLFSVAVDGNETKTGQRHLDQHVHLRRAVARSEGYGANSSPWIESSVNSLMNPTGSRSQPKETHEEANLRRCSNWSPVDRWRPLSWRSTNFTSTVVSWVKSQEFPNQPRWSSLSYPEGEGVQLRGLYWPYPINSTLEKINRRTRFDDEDLEIEARHTVLINKILRHPQATTLMITSTTAQFSLMSNLTNPTEHLWHTPPTH